MQIHPHASVRLALLAALPTALPAAFLVSVLLTATGCASSGSRVEPDRAALQAAIEASQNGDPELAATLADDAAARCAPGEAGLTCSFTTRLVLAQQFSAQGNAEGALSQARSASDLADAHGDAVAQYTARGALAAIAVQAEEIETAESALREARAAIDEVIRQATPAERDVLEQTRRMLQAPQAGIHMLKGDPEAAARSQTEVVRALRRIDPTHRNLPSHLLDLAYMHEAAGDLESAISSLQAAASLAAELGNREIEDEALAAIEALSSPE